MSSFVAQPSEKCTACGRTVYATEKTVVDDKEQKKVYHKTCIRCKQCNKVLAVGQFSALEGVFYCIPHFKQLFASKGNYDESFGKEKVSAKWTESPATGVPTSFIPETRDEAPTSEKKQTSEATASLFKKFREEGDSNKCHVCDKTVYLAEKLLVENKDGKMLFHKACFKCSVCELTLDLRNYGSVAGKIYCKNHLKEVSGISNPKAFASAPTSFIPSTESESTERKSDKKETSEATAAVFKKFREEGESNKCHICDKTVYLAEKLLVENKDGKMLFHKICFKCTVCELALDLRNYGSFDNKIYCKNHLKEVQSTRNSGTYTPASKSFVPEVIEGTSPQKNQTPDHIAAKFKGLGIQGDKCKACGKTVYLAEKLTVEELNKQSIYHKTCFKCNKCNIQLDISNFGSVGGTIYCKVHLKEYGKPEQVREGGIFISPLANKDENYVAGIRDSNEDELGKYADQPDEEVSIRRSQDEESPRRYEEEEEGGGRERVGSVASQGVEEEEEGRRRSLESEDPEEVERRRREAERKQRAEERQRLQEEEERKYEEEKQKRRNRLSGSANSVEGGSSGGNNETANADDERRKRREEREKQRLEEEKKYEEEKQKREREREERRKQREEEDKREEEERERRKKEREERRRQQEEEESK